jgi:hypothetical protein
MLTALPHGTARGRLLVATPACINFEINQNCHAVSNHSASFTKTHSRTEVRERLPVTTQRLADLCLNRARNWLVFARCLTGPSRTQSVAYVTRVTPNISGVIITSQERSRKKWDLLEEPSHQEKRVTAAKETSDSRQCSLRPL